MQYQRGVATLTGWLVHSVSGTLLHCVPKKFVLHSVTLFKNYMILLKKNPLPKAGELTSRGSIRSETIA